MKKLKNPTYEQLMEGAKRHLTVTYTVTQEINGLELSENGVNAMVFAKNERGQANIIAENGKFRDGVSNVVINDWFVTKPTEGNKEGVAMDKIDNTPRELRDVDLDHIALEQDIRAIWGDTVVDGLLDLMTFKELLNWAKKPNEFFVDSTPSQAFVELGESILLEFVNHQKYNGYL